MQFRRAVLFYSLFVFVGSACGDCHSQSRDTDVSIDSDTDAGDSADADDVDSSDRRTGLLEGAGADRAIDRIPDEAVADHPEDAWFDGGPVPVSLQRFVVSLADEAVVAQVNALLIEHDAVIVGGSSLAGWLAADVEPDDTGERLSAVVEAFIASDATIAAFPESGVEPLVVPPNDRGETMNGCPDSISTWEWRTSEQGANWGLKFIRAPYAWNARDFLMGAGELPTVAVIEFGFIRDHPDVTFSETPAGSSDAERASHGLAVGSMIAAKYNDFGVEGVVPTNDDLPLTMRGFVTNSVFFTYAADSAELARLEAVISNTNARVINNSNGKPYVKDGQQTNPDTDKTWGGLGKTWRDYMDERGRVWSTTATRLAESVRGDFIVTCAAGNDGLTDAFTYLARDTGGCTNGAVIAGNERLLAVENLFTSPANAGNDLHTSSNRRGNIAAPGTCMGSASANGGYALETGTSFAAPIVAGAIAFLWGLFPDATFDEVRAALFAGARGPSGETSRRLDVYGAMLSLDATAGDGRVEFALLDVGDESVDGNMRVTPDQQPVGVSPRGDGCIDMRDFRAMRDALIQVRDPGANALDGDANHPKRDLNGDGFVAPADMIPASVSDDEGVWSRFDFDGNGVVDTDDLDLLLARWGECHDQTKSPRTEGHTVDDLATLDPATGMTSYPMLESFDVWLKLPDPTRETYVSVTGARDRWVDPTEAGEVFVDSSGDAWAVVTAPTRCDADRQRACVLPRGGVMNCEDVIESGAPDPGADHAIDPSGDVPAAQPGLMIWSDAAVEPLNLPTLLKGIRQWDGNQFTTPIDLSDLDVGRYQDVSPDGEWAIFDSCWGASGQFVEGECLLMQNFDIDFADNDATFLFLPGDPGFVRPRQWLPNGHTLIVSAIRFPGDRHRLYHFDLEKAKECQAFGGPRDCGSASVESPFTEIPSADDLHNGQAPGTLFNGWTVYTATDNTTRGWLPGSQVIDGVCADAPETELYASDQNEFLASAVPSGVSSDRFMLMVRLENGAWHMTGVTPTGNTFEVGEPSGRPQHFMAAWGTTGRTLAYHDGDQVVIADVSLDGTLTTRHEIGAPGELDQAALSFGPGSSYLVAYIPGGIAGTGVGTLHAFGTATGMKVGSWTHEESQGKPAWSGSGDQIAVVQVNTVGERNDFDVYVVDLPTATLTNITAGIQHVDCEGEPTCPYSDQYDPSWRRMIDWN